jgi:FkbM family methyltransferase
MHKTLRALAYLSQRYLLQRPRLTGRAPEFQLSLRFKTADVMGRHIYKYGVYEEQITRFLLANLSLGRGDIFLDVGANIGWYSLLLARHQPAGVVVHGFEPDPETFALLEGNLRLNQLTGARAWRCALSDSPGSKTLYRYSDKNTGRNSLLPINSAGQVEIESLRLDEFVRREGLETARIRFLKIDVEGYECAVLRGMGGLLPQVPLILSEYSPRYMRRGGLEPQEFLDLFRGAGFQPWLFEGAGLRAATWEELEEQSSNTNILWLNEGQHQRIPLRRLP